MAVDDEPARHPAAVRVGAARGRSRASRRSTPPAGPSRRGRAWSMRASMCRTRAYCRSSGPQRVVEQHVPRRGHRCRGRPRAAAAGPAGRQARSARQQCRAARPAHSLVDMCSTPGADGPVTAPSCNHAGPRSRRRPGHACRSAGHRHTFTDPSTHRPVRSLVPSTRNRYRLLAGALLCLLVVVALAVVYKNDVKRARRARQGPRRRPAGVDLPAPGRAALPARRRGGVQARCR